MGFEPLDGIKLLLLMAAGLIFCIAGLYLLIRPKPEGSAAKIELFGLKFESSSAGLLVFLIGAAFLAVPMFVPEKSVVVMVPEKRLIPDAETRKVSPPDSKETGGGQTASSALAPVAPSNLALQTNEIINEKEPNDSERQANPLAIGQRVSGDTIRDKPDWFVVRVPDGGLVGYEIMLKHVNGYEVRVAVYNAKEEHMGWIETNNGAKYLAITSDFSDRMFLKVWSIHSVGVGSYELAIFPPDGN